MSIRLFQWIPALLMMVVIFLISARTPSELPYFAWADGVIKKGAHMFGYALLAVLYWRALDLKPESLWVAWLLALAYAVTDEFHQSYVPGRTSSPWDVLIFDNLGALSSLWMATRYSKQKNRAL
jgi:VanZ family protein